MRCLQKKTEFILFKSKNSSDQGAFDTLEIGQSVINRVDKFKYLGLQIDSDISWKSHVDMIAANIAPYVGLLKQIRPFVKQNIALQIYFAHIHSRLIYCLPVWSSCTLEQKNRLQRLQNKAIKVITKKPRLTPSSELYDEKFLSFLQLCDYESIFFIHKVKSGLIKSDITLSVNENTTNRKTRQSELLRPPQFMTVQSQSSLFYRGVNLYNQFHISKSNKSNVESLSTLKSSIKRFVVHNLK